MAYAVPLRYSTQLANHGTAAAIRTTSLHTPLARLLTAGRVTHNSLSPSRSWVSAALSTNDAEPKHTFPLRNFTAKPAQEQPAAPAAAPVQAATDPMLVALFGACSVSAIALIGVSTMAPVLPAAAVSFLKIAPPIAAQFVFFAPLATMKDIKAKESVGDLPILPYAAMVINGVLWVTYGALVGEPTIMAPNFSAMVMGSYYWYTYNQYKPSSMNMAPWFVGCAASIAAIGGIAAMMPQSMAVNALGLMGNAVVLAMFGGPLAAMKTVLAKKSTESLPFIMTLATYANCVLWTSFGAMVVHDPYIWFCNSLGLASALVQLGLFAKFGRAVATSTPKAA